MNKQYSLYKLVNVVVVFNFLGLGLLTYWGLSLILGTGQLAQWEKLAKWFWFVTLIFAGGVSIIIKLVLEEALKSLIKLMQQIKNVVDGSYEEIELLSSRYREISDLQTDFEVMADTVQLREQALKRYAGEVEEKNDELIETKQKLADQIGKVQRLHEQLLADQFPDLEEVFFAAYYQPARKIGGDFYNVIEIEEKIIYYLVDITGHGLDGAFLNVFIRETINNYLFSWYRWGGEITPQNIMKFINQRYRDENFPDDYFISLALFMLDKETKEVVYTNAGIQSLPLLRTPEGIKTLQTSELPISAAVEAEMYQFPEERFKLVPGSSLLLTTDGLLEEENSSGIMYGQERLKKVLERNYRLPPQLLVQAIQRDFVQFNGCDQQDDITLLAVRREIIEDSYTTTIISSLPHLQDEMEVLNQFLTDYYSSPQELTEDVEGILTKLVVDNNKWEFIIRVIVVEKYIKLEIKNLESRFHWGEEINCSHFAADCTTSPQHFDYLCYNNTGRKAILVKYS